VRVRVRAAGAAYKQREYCSAAGLPGANWETEAWGAIELYASGGLSALDVCCACGGGTHPDVDQVDPDLDPTAPACADAGGWIDGDGFNCTEWASAAWCVRPPVRLNRTLHGS
jgi:hypothetical protein